MHLLTVFKATIIGGTLALASCSSGSGSGSGSASSAQAQYAQLRVLSDGQTYYPFEPVRFNLNKSEVANPHKIYLRYRSASTAELRQKAALIAETDSAYAYSVQIPVLDEFASDLMSVQVTLSTDGSQSTDFRITLHALPSLQYHPTDGQLSLDIMSSMVTKQREYTQQYIREIERSSFSTLQRDSVIGAVQSALASSERMEEQLRELVQNGVPILSADGSQILLESSQLALLDKMQLAMIAQRNQDGSIYSDGGAALGELDVGFRTRPRSRTSFFTDPQKAIREYTNTVIGDSQKISQVLGGVLFVAGLITTAPVGVPLAVSGATLFMVSTWLPAIYSAALNSATSYIINDIAEFEDIQPGLKHIGQSYAELAVDEVLDLPIPGSVLVGEIVDGLENSWDLMQETVDIVEDIRTDAESNPNPNPNLNPNVVSTEPPPDCTDFLSAAFCDDPELLGPDTFIQLLDACIDNTVSDSRCDDILNPISDDFSFTIEVSPRAMTFNFADPEDSRITGSFEHYTPDVNLQYNLVPNGAFEPGTDYRVDWCVAIHSFDRLVFDDDGVGVQLGSFYPVDYLSGYAGGLWAENYQLDSACYTTYDRLQLNLEVVNNQMIELVSAHVYRPGPATEVTVDDTTVVIDGTPIGVVIDKREYSLIYSP